MRATQAFKSKKKRWYPLWANRWRGRNERLLETPFSPLPRAARFHWVQKCLLKIHLTRIHSGQEDPSSFSRCGAAAAPLGQVVLLFFLYPSIDWFGPGAADSDIPAYPRRSLLIALSDEAPVLVRMFRRAVSRNFNAENPDFDELPKLRTCRLPLSAPQPFVT